MTFTLTTGIHGILRNDDRVTFTPIDNKTLQGDLNYKALGFLSKLLSLPPNWKIKVNDLMTRFQVKRYTVLARLRELEAAGYLIRQRLRDEAGRFYYVHIIRETPNTVGVVKGGLGGEVVETSDSADSSVVRFSVVESPAVRKPDLLIDNKSIKERDKKDPLTKVGDVVVSSSLGNTEQPKSEILVDDTLQMISEETIETTSSEPSQTESLVISEPLEKGNIPATCYKPKPIKLQNKGNITSTEKDNYQVKLAAIGVAVQNVEWVIRQIPAQEREKVVSDAIAWMSEQKWVQSPAAVFVDAVRTRKQSAAVVSEELRQIIDQNKSKSQQFAEWFDAGKIQGLVEQSVSHPEHYATVVFTNKAIELLAQLQQEKEFAELERMIQSDRDERLAEMERVELAGEVTLPSYGQPMPWQEARELLSCLTQEVILRLTQDID